MKIQIALDLTDRAKTLNLASKIQAKCEQKELDYNFIILEAGTPLIKYYGIGFLANIKLAAPSLQLLADLKTVDVAQLEFELAYNHGADIATVLAQAPINTILKAVETAVKHEKLVSIDFIGVPPTILEDKFDSILKSIENYTENPEKYVIFSFHRAIDEEKDRVISLESMLDFVKRIKENYPNLTVAVAGGLTPIYKGMLQDANVDIAVVGRYITTSADPISRIKEFL